jgi:hypothetical protein
MTSSLVFNHHSLPFGVVSDADKAIPDFLKVCIKSQNMGFATIIVDNAVDPNWFRLELAKGYFWQDWYEKNKNTKNINIIRAFRSIATKQPFFSIEDIEDDVDLFDVSFNEDSSFSALRAAAWHEAPLASLPTRAPWLGSPLQVTVKTLDEAGEIVNQLINILNFYSLESFENEVAALCQQRNSLVKSGKELFDMQEQLFPNLTFCGTAPQQLNQWSASKTILEQVKESLSSLNSFCEKWADETYDRYRHELLQEVGLNHKVSGESDKVMKDPRLRRQREFWLPEGRKEFFENHVKLSNGYRLHFFVDNQAKHIYVGHIGPHLKLS